MAYSAHPWCGFNALDNIVPAAPGVLGDFSFVSRVLDGRRKRFSLLPFLEPCGTIALQSSSFCTMDS